MRRRPPRSTLTDTLFPTRRSSDLVAIVGNLDAGHALERGGGGGIGQLADILRDDRIDRLDRILLDLGGAFQRRADAGDDDGVLSRLVRQSGLRSRRSKIGRALCGERWCQHGWISGVAVSVKQNHTSENT